MHNRRKLELLKRVLYARDREQDFLQEQRVESLRQEKLEEKEDLIADIQRRRIKTLRKLSVARKEKEPVVRLGKTHRPKRDIIAEYTEYGSKIYVPTLREGDVPYGTNFRDVDLPELRSVQGLMAIEKDIMAKGYLDVKIKRAKKRGKLLDRCALNSAMITVH